MPPEETPQPEIIPEAVPETISIEPASIQSIPPEPTSVESAPVVEDPTIPTPPEQVVLAEPAPTPPSTQPQPELPQHPPTLHTKLSSLLATARNLIQTRRNQKLEKIVAFALNQKAKGKSVTNDEVEKLLHVSDRSASRYLNVLVKQGRLKVSGVKKGATYEISG